MFDASFQGEHMMIKTERIALRLEPQLREQAEKLIQQGKFKNLSQVVREALKEFLENA